MVGSKLPGMEARAPKRPLLGSLGNEEVLETSANVLSSLPGVVQFASIGLQIGAGRAANNQLIEDLVFTPSVDAFIRSKLEIADERALTTDDFYDLASKVTTITNELDKLEKSTNEKTWKFASSVSGSVVGAGVTSFLLPITGIPGMIISGIGGWFAGGAAEEFYANNIASARCTNRIGLLHSVCGYEQSMRQAGLAAYDENGTRAILLLTCEDEVQKEIEEKLGCRLEDALLAHMKTSLLTALPQTKDIEISINEHQMAQRLNEVMSERETDILLAENLGSNFKHLGAQYTLLLNEGRLNVAQMVLDSPQETALLAQQKWLQWQQELAQKRRQLTAGNNLQQQGVTTAGPNIQQGTAPLTPPQQNANGQPARQA